MVIPVLHISDSLTRMNGGIISLRAEITSAVVIYALLQDRRCRFITLFVLCFIQELYPSPNKVSPSSSKTYSTSITEIVVNRYIRHIEHIISALIEFRLFTHIIRSPIFLLEIPTANADFCTLYQLNIYQHVDRSQICYHRGGKVVKLS
jgi:hypothetical protein